MFKFIYCVCCFFHLFRSILLRSKEGFLKCVCPVFKRYLTNEAMNPPSTPHPTPTPTPPVVCCERVNTTDVPESRATTLTTPPHPRHAHRGPSVVSAGGPPPVDRGVGDPIGRGRVGFPPRRQASFRRTVK